MQRRLVFVLGGFVVLAVATWVVWRVSFRDITTLVSASEIVKDAGRQGDTSSAPSAAATSSPTDTTTTTTSSTIKAPPTTAIGFSFVVGTAPGDSGLYAYDTEGFEEIDALGGARHDYPAETFLTIQPGGCGSIVRWTALEERWSESELCPDDDGVHLAGFRSYHEWFGRSDLQDFSCDVDAALVVPDTGSGAWKYECSTNERSEIWTVEVIGLETLQVGGKSVKSVHVRVGSTLEGASEGGSEADIWYLSGTSLILRKVASSDSTNESPIGDVHYTEQYEMSLVSLMPRGA